MKIKSERVVYKNYRTITERIYIDKEGKESIWELRGGKYLGVGIIALTKDDKIILVKEFRPGPNKYYIDIPGGTTEGNEDPISCAKRELLEETGYVGKSFKILGKYFLDSYSVNPHYTILIKDCTYLEQKEDLKVILKPYKEYLKNINPKNTVNLHSLYLAKEYLL